MVQAIYGFLSPASGATVEPLRDKVSFEILVQRTNLATWEHKGCSKCTNHNDIIVMSIDKKPVFYDCPCGHRWLTGQKNSPQSQTKE